MSTTIGGVRIVDMPDLGAVTDDSSVVGEHAGSGRFAATAFRTYVAGLGTTNIGRNLLHNPLFSIWQRGPGLFAPPAGTIAYTADRWQTFPFASGDTCNVGQAAANGVPQEDARFVASCSFIGGAGAGNACRFSQRIEDVRRLAGKTVTLSFYATAGAAVGVGVSFDQSFGTGGSPSAATAGIGQKVTVPGAAWARYSLTFNIASVASKVLGSNGDDFSVLNIWLSAGSSFVTPSGGVGVQSGVVNFWGMQLEVGSVATPLERPDMRYDLSNAQRFFQTNNTVFTIGGASQLGAIIVWPVYFQTQMRAAPTVNVSVSGGSGYSAIAVGGSSGQQFAVNLTGSAAQYIANFVGWNASADL